MILVECPVGTLGVDTAAKLTLAACREIRKAGFAFVVRYVSIGSRSRGDITKDEVGAIFKANLGLMLVQHVRFAGWLPTGETGAQDGRNAADHAFSVLGASSICGVRIPLACDWEGANLQTTKKQAIAYLDRWAESAAGGTSIAAAFDPELYVGAAPILTGAELGALAGYRRYWQSQSHVPIPTPRGYQKIQLYPDVSIAGVPVDVNVTQQDRRGSKPLMVKGA